MGKSPLHLIIAAVLLLFVAAVLSIAAAVGKPSPNDHVSVVTVAAVGDAATDDDDDDVGGGGAAVALCVLIALFYHTSMARTVPHSLPLSSSSLPTPPAPWLHQQQHHFCLSLTSQADLNLFLAATRRTFSLFPGNVLFSWDGTSRLHQTT